MFVLTKIEGGRINVPEPEYFVCDSAVSKGAACTLSGGKLTPGTDKPTYITLAGVDEKEVPKEIPVCRVEPNQVYEVTISDAPTSLVVGDKVTIKTAGDDEDVGVEVTATKTDGVATIVSLDGATKAGDTVLVRFE